MDHLSKAVLLTLNKYSINGNINNESLNMAMKRFRLKRLDMKIVMKELERNGFCRMEYHGMGKVNIKICKELI